MVSAAPFNSSLAFWMCTQNCIKLLLLLAGIVTPMAFEIPRNSFFKNQELQEILHTKGYSVYAGDACWTSRLVVYWLLSISSSSPESPHHDNLAVFMSRHVLSSHWPHHGLVFRNDYRLMIKWLNENRILEITIPWWLFRSECVEICPPWHADTDLG